MATATSNGVTLELNEAEAKALYVLLNATCRMGAFSDELLDMYRSMAALGFVPDEYRVRFNATSESIYISEGRR